MSYIACYYSQLDDFYAELKWEFHTWGELCGVYRLQSVLCGTAGGLYLRRNGLMNVSGGHGSAVKGSAIDLEVAGSGPVSCHFSFPSSPYHVAL